MKCYHCGDECVHVVTYQKHPFCCVGCKTVFQILEDNNLDEYYQLEDTPGIKMALPENHEQFTFLDLEEIKHRFILFDDGNISKISFSIPQIHCSSCIWLLENLNRLAEGILYSRVNFAARRADITFQNSLITLRQVVELLHTIGYEPDLKSSTSQEKSAPDRSIIYKIGIAGFCFGNIMLLAFPEYLGIDESFQSFRNFFGWISLLLSIPVLLYSGIDYLKNAWSGFRQRYVNMDIPIALGMLTLFIRSSYEVITATGAGYFDSLSGLVFFLLLGKWFQQKTYDSLSFERDYKSYFPIAVHKKNGSGYVPVQIEELAMGNEIEIRNNELIPADSVLMDGEAYIDYSFVTGESTPIRKQQGDLLYAGGRQTGTKIYLQTVKEVNNSYLTQLWNQDVFQKEEKQTNLNTTSNQVSKYFTLVIILITLGTAAYWWFTNPVVLWNAVTAVLIVACPCALALSVPFTLGNGMRAMGKMGLYLKNADIIEKLAKISTLVLDKTGTITHRENMGVLYVGEELTPEEKQVVKSLSGNSVHPLSVAVFESIETENQTTPQQFQEFPGKGIQGKISDIEIKLGSAEFVGTGDTEVGTTKVFVSINGYIKGYFRLQQRYRKGLKEMIQSLKMRFDIHLLTGDNNSQEEYLSKELKITQLYFNQSPMDKLLHIQKLQSQGKSIVMLGDGLNDAGALKQSDVGIAISDNIHQFSPACDAILNAKQFRYLPYFIHLAKKSIRVIYFSFLISFLYNVIGLSFAVNGKLSPIVAAILMPLSSITVVAFATFSVRYWAGKHVD